MDNDEDFTQAIERTFGVKRRDGGTAQDRGLVDVALRPRKPKTNLLAAGIGVAAGTAIGLGLTLYARAKLASSGGGADKPSAEPDAEPADDVGDASSDDANDPVPHPQSKPAPDIGEGWWSRVPELPSSEDVAEFEIDLVQNWGSTPAKLRPLFALMEGVSKIRGSGRIFALIAFREAGFQAAAHNDSEEEVSGSRRAYKNARDRNRPLKYGDASAEFGSGGLFGALAPYFLWTGVQAMKADAPLLHSPPEVMFVPRIAAFGAVVYMRRILSYYQIDDHADIKVGWASPTLLKGGRGGNTYKAVRTRFFADAGRLGLKLDDTTTIPKSLSAADWPGVSSAFTKLTGLDPRETQEE